MPLEFFWSVTHTAAAMFFFRLYPVPLSPMFKRQSPQCQLLII